MRSPDLLFSRELEHGYAGCEGGALLSWSDAQGLARFVAHVWPVRPFWEGSTRTVAVFLALRLRSTGFDVSSEPFERRAAYFRGSLVRATYQNRPIGVGLDTAHPASFLTKLMEDRGGELDHDAPWRRPLFAHPGRVRNVSLADAIPVRRELGQEGVTRRIPSGMRPGC